MIIKLKSTTPYMYFLWKLVPGMLATVTAQGIGDDRGRIQILARNWRAGGYDAIWLDIDECQVVRDDANEAFDEQGLSQRNHFFNYMYWPTQADYEWIRDHDAL